VAEAAAESPGFVLLHYCQTFHWASISRSHEGTMNRLRNLPVHSHHWGHFLTEELSHRVGKTCEYSWPLQQTEHLKRKDMSHQASTNVIGSFNTRMSALELDEKTTTLSALTSLKHGSMISPTLTARSQTIFKAFSFKV